MPYDIATRITSGGVLVVDVIKSYRYAGGYLPPEKADRFYRLFVDYDGNAEAYDIAHHHNILSASEMQHFRWYINNHPQGREQLAAGLIPIDKTLIRKYAPDICKNFADHLDANGERFIPSLPRVCVNSALSYTAARKAKQQKMVEEAEKKRIARMDILLPHSDPAIKAAAVNASDDDAPHIVRTEQDRFDLAEMNSRLIRIQRQ